MIIYSEILLCHKKEWNNAICNNIDGPRDYHLVRIIPTEVTLIMIPDGPRFLLFNES